MKESFLRKSRESARVAQELIERDSAKLTSCIGEMAERFRSGGRLFTMGNGGSACDAMHLAVEFKHPILEKRRAIPAIALAAEVASLTAIGNDADFALVFSEELKLLGTAADVALGISTSGQSANVLRGLKQARKMGMLTIAFSGRDGGRLIEVAQYCFVVPSFSIHRIQETHTLLLHLLWDHVHVALGEEDVL